jgi:hypothetical protein
VDGSASSLAALAYAAATAEGTSAPLTLVCAWNRLAEDAWVDAYSRGTVQEGGDLRLADRKLAQEALDAAVTWVRKEHPDVAVTPFLAQSRPASALITAGPDAGLLVVGLEGTGPSPACCSAR